MDQFFSIVSKWSLLLSNGQKILIWLTAKIKKIIFMTHHMTCVLLGGII